MSAIAANSPALDPVAQRKGDQPPDHGLRLGFGVLLSGYVINEPAPYELYMTGMIAIWALFGLRLSRTNAPLLMIFVLFNVGGMIAMTQMAILGDAVLYIAVSLFLAFTAVILCCGDRARQNPAPGHFHSLSCCCLFTAVLGFAGYFSLFRALPFSRCTSVPAVVFRIQTCLARS